MRSLGLHIPHMDSSCPNTADADASNALREVSLIIGMLMQRRLLAPMLKAQGITLS